MPYSAYTRRKKQEVMERYGGVCVCCGEQDIRFLTLDHIDGKGAEHRRELAPNRPTRPSGGTSFYIHLLRQEDDDPNIQILCWGCNSAKGKRENCPHQDILTNLGDKRILKEYLIAPGGVMAATQVIR